MQEINRDDLEIGKPYYIESLTYADNNNNINNLILNDSYPKVFATFEGYNKPSPLFPNVRFVNFKNFKHINQERIVDGYDVSLNLLWKFYEVKKYKIQQDMETRACNLFLQKIIGDPHFKM